MLIEQLIGDLLLRHNCVVVPAFGGFVAKQTSAVLDVANGIMLPPKKSLLFNKQLINNDGLLIASFAKETGRSYNEASEEIQLQVEKWQKILHSGERITLDKVGYLFLDQEKNIGFEQDRYFNLLLQSYGLGKVHFISEEDIQIIAKPAHTEISVQPIERMIQVETPIIELIPEGVPTIETQQEGQARIIAMPEKTTSIKLWKYVAAAALIPIAFYSYWIPMKTKVLESGVFAFQDFNPFHSEDTGTYQTKELSFKANPADFKEISVEKEVANLSEDVSVWSYPFDENLYMPVRIREKSSTVAETPVAEIPAEKIEKVEKVIAATPVKTAKTGNYHLIANCFSSEANAEKFVTYLKSKGLDAYILDVNKGLHRVSAGRANSSSALTNVQETLENLQVEGSWVLNK